MPQQVTTVQRWQPDLFPKQWELLSYCRPNQKNLVLASGPRWASKTVGCLHALVDHAYHTDRANISLISITQSVGIDSGIWTDISQDVIPTWIRGNFGMRWHRPPYIQSVTKKPCCEIINKFGTVSKFALDSLKDEKDVEDRYKSRRYSAIFVNELSKFKKRKTFDTLKQCLRMVHLREEEHLLLCDTNPADEGERSWIHELWYQFRTCADDELHKFIAPGASAEVLKPLRDALRLIEFTVDDNLAAGPAKKASLMADFAHDEDLLARYFYGKWVAAAVDAIYYKVFRPMVHVIGEEPTRANSEPETMVPEDNCYELFTGWDLGDTHSAFAVLEKVTTIVRRKKIVDGKLEDVDVSVVSFKMLDELVVHNDFDLREFVMKAMEKCFYWSDILGRKLLWKHYSDRNVFSRKELDGDLYLNQLVYQISDGFFELIGAWDAQRGSSVDRRIDFLRRLLFENRFFVSRPRCPEAVKMLKGMKRKENATSGIAKGSIHKHVFDAITYIAASECYEELVAALINSTKRLRPGESSLVQVAL